MNKCYAITFSNPTEKRYIIASSIGLAIIRAERWASQHWKDSLVPVESATLIGDACEPKAEPPAGKDTP